MDRLSNSIDETGRRKEDDKPVCDVIKDMQ
jgi:hypothetical protein